MIEERIRVHDIATLPVGARLVVNHLNHLHTCLTVLEPFAERTSGMTGVLCHYDDGRGGGWDTILSDPSTTGSTLWRINPATCPHTQLHKLNEFTRECLRCGARTFAVHPDAVTNGLGPQQIGGRYRSHWGTVYTVIAIEHYAFDMPWAITVKDDDGRVRRHCTPWDPRNQIVSQPAAGQPAEGETQ